MAIKSFNPYSPSRRSMTVSTFEEITTDYDALCYASYFAEMVQYLSREGIEAAE